MADEKNTRPQSTTVPREPSPYNPPPQSTTAPLCGQSVRMVEFGRCANPKPCPMHDDQPVVTVTTTVGVYTTEPEIVSGEGETDHDREELLDRIAELEAQEEAWGAANNTLRARVLDLERQVTDLQIRLGTTEYVRAE